MNWKLKKLKWIGMDLDNCLAFTNPDNDYDLDVALPNVELIKAMRADHKKRFIIFSSRHWQDYQQIEHWLNLYKVPYKAIVCGKLLVDKYVDDRALRPEEYVREVLNGT